MGYYLDRINKAIGRRVFNLMDSLIDKRICGQSLTKYVPSVYRNDKEGIGMTGSESTHYVYLERIFSHVTITEDDSFLDVGCGKGRVLAFLLKKGYQCKISGIEINEISGRVAKEWTARYDQINMEIGNAFDLDLDQYTVFFLFRPFLPKTFLEFIEKLEGQLTHPITFIYWADQQSGYLLQDRKGWEMKCHDSIYRMYGLLSYMTPQGFSIWEYKPDSVKNK